MKDKLTKKRIKVDYSLIILVLNLEQDFLMYQIDRKTNRSLRRQQYTFLMQKHVDIEAVYLSCKEHGLTSHEDWLKEQYRIAQTPWLED